jgi:hypothetical protein
MKIDITKFMSHENALEFIRILFEHRDKNHQVNMELPDGTIVELRLNPDLNPPRSIDSV